jgi:hypothetical protein
MKIKSQWMESFIGFARLLLERMHCFPIKQRRAEEYRICHFGKQSALLDQLGAGRGRVASDSV